MRKLQCRTETGEFTPHIPPQLTRKKVESNRTTEITELISISSTTHKDSYARTLVSEIDGEWVMKFPMLNSAIL